MFKPVSLVAFAIGTATMTSYVRSSSAISDDANQVGLAISKVLEGRLDTESLLGTKGATLSQLMEAVEELAIDDDQVPVDERTLRNAELLVLALPDNLPPPIVGVDPDGAISLTWSASRTRLFSVSVSDSARMAYAWMDGSDKGHAVERFSSPSLPTRFLSSLQSIIGNEAPALRAA